MFLIGGLWVRVQYLAHTGTIIQLGQLGQEGAALEWTDGSSRALTG